MAVRKINRGSEIRTKGKSMGRERSGAMSLPEGSANPAAIAFRQPFASTPDWALPLVRTHQVSLAALLFLAGRVALMLVGIAVMGLGIDIVVKANLGNSPISACSYVASLAFPSVSFGVFMLVWQCVLIVTQIVILRREFRLVDLLQIPVSVVFGLCIDAFAVLLQPLSVNSYGESLICLAVGIAVLALGVTMTVVSGTVMNCGEAVVQAVVRKTNARFGTMKVLFDVTCAALAIALSFALMGQLEGVREGTIISALCTGMVVNFYMFLYGKLRSRDRAGR